ncbi:MAG TPA: response regulator [Vicinamibacterales bacterium]
MQDLAEAYPSARPRRRSASATRQPRVPAGGRPRVVLLADDDPVVRHVVRLLLELQGYKVLEAEDGLDAVAQSLAHEGPIDALVTDVMMPGLNGAQVCLRVRETRPDTPTLFISGYYPEAVFPNQQLPARSAFLSKPFMPEELNEAMDRLLGAVAEGPLWTGSAVSSEKA